MIMMTPCKNCPDRHDLCHADCGQYLEFKQNYEAEKMAFREQKNIDHALDALHLFGSMSRRQSKKPPKRERVKRFYE